MERDGFTREELQRLRHRAIDLAKITPPNAWQRAYVALADAADRLDAMWARCTVVADGPVDSDPGA